MVSIAKTVERGDSSDGDCERGGMGSLEVNMVHIIRIMDSLKGRGFPVENPYPPGVKCPLLPPRETLYMYGIHTPNNKDLCNNHTVHTAYLCAPKGHSELYGELGDGLPPQWTQWVWSVHSWNQTEWTLWLDYW